MSKIITGKVEALHIANLNRDTYHIEDEQGEDLIISDELSEYEGKDVVITIEEDWEHNLE
jgi:hypothetical protein